jgi:hypothetical protein
MTVDGTDGAAASDVSEFQRAVTVERGAEVRFWRLAVRAFAS